MFHLLIFDCVLLSEEECGGEGSSGGLWAFLSSCGRSSCISPQPEDAKTVNPGWCFICPTQALCTQLFSNKDQLGKRRGARGRDASKTE